MNFDKTILVGCEVLIIEKDQLLLGKRKNCFGAGTWALPGGHLEYDERMVEAACREMQEELGASILPSDLKLISIVDTLPYEGSDKHYIHISFELQSPSFKPQLMEPERCEEWRYFALDDLPLDNFFKPHRAIIENYLQKRLYSL